MRRFKKSSVLLLAVIVLLILPLASIKGDTGVTTDAKIAVDNHQLILEEQATSGEVETLKVIDWLALDGSGTITVDKPSGLENDPKVQAMNGFTAPEVKDGTMTWKDVKIDGNRSIVSQSTADSDSRDAAIEDIPLELKYSYWLDGEKVENLEDIAGKSGRFRLECYMKNTSKEKRLVTYEDSITGKKVRERVETYLPIVISPTNWFFDNKVFSNLKTDPTGLVFYLPTVYQGGWSIPLFPPATEVDNTIWVEADVKNFAMEPLTMAIAFVFPHTNQTDPLPQFQAGLSELYGGVVQLGAGLAEAVAGLGSTGAANTLIFGANAIAGGLAQLGGPEGLPKAGAALSDQLIPGVEMLYEGIGAPTTADTLLYAVNAVMDGLAQAQAGIGSPTTPDSLLYAETAITGGLGTMATGIGSATTPDTLLYGTNAITGGLTGIKGGIGSSSTAGTLLFASNAVTGGLGQMSAAIGTPNPTEDSLLGGLEAMKYGIGVPNPLEKSLLGGLEAIKAGIGTTTSGPFPPDPNATLQRSLQFMKDNIGSQTVPAATLLYAAASVMNGLSHTPSPPLDPGGILEGLQQIKAGIGDKVAPAAGTLLWVLNDMLAETAADGPLLHDFIGPVVDGMSSGGGGMYDWVVANIADPTERTTLTDYMDDYVGLLETDPDNATAGIQTMNGLLTAAIPQVKLSVDGLDQMIDGLGTTTTPGKILYGVSKIIEGLEAIKAGIGVPNPYEASLLGGLEKIKYGIGTTGDPFPPDPNATLESSLQYMKSGIGAVSDLPTESLQGGLQYMKNGIGSPTTGDTLLYAENAITGGLGDIKAGIGSSTTPDSLLYGTHALTGGLAEFLKGIGSATTDSTLLYASTAVTGGLTQLSGAIGTVATPNTLLYGANAIFGGLETIKAAVSTSSMADPGLLEGLEQLEEGTNEAVAGTGQLLDGASQIEGGLGELQGGLTKAVTEGTNVMQQGLAENITQLDLTQGELVAIEDAGNEFDAFLGKVDNPSDADNDVRLLTQTKPVQTPMNTSSWIWMLIIGLAAAVGIVLFGSFAFRKLSA